MKLPNITRGQVIHIAADAVLVGAVIGSARIAIRFARAGGVLMKEVESNREAIKNQQRLHDLASIIWYLDRAKTDQGLFQQAYWARAAHHYLRSYLRVYPTPDFPLPTLPDARILMNEKFEVYFRKLSRDALKGRKNAYSRLWWHYQEVMHPRSTVVDIPKSCYLGLDGTELYVWPPGLHLTMLAKMHGKPYPNPS